MDINVNEPTVNGGFWAEMQKMMDDQTIYTPAMVEGLQQITREVAKEQKKVADQYESDE